MTGLSLPNGQSALEFITLDELRRTHDRIRPFINRTPIIRNDYFSKRLSELVGHDICVQFKCESFQPTGSFKLRGAANGVLKAINNSTAIQGVATSSSGNHGAAVAHIAKKVNLNSAIVVSEDISETKLENIADYGGEIIKIQPNNISSL